MGITQDTLPKTLQAVKDALTALRGVLPNAFRYVDADHMDHRAQNDPTSPNRVLVRITVTRHSDDDTWTAHESEIRKTFADVWARCEVAWLSLDLAIQLADEARNPSLIVDPSNTSGIKKPIAIDAIEKTRFRTRHVVTHPCSHTSERTTPLDLPISEITNYWKFMSARVVVTTQTFDLTIDNLLLQDRQELMWYIRGEGVMPSQMLPPRGFSVWLCSDLIHSNKHLLDGISLLASGTMDDGTDLRSHSRSHPFPHDFNIAQLKASHELMCAAMCGRFSATSTIEESEKVLRFYRVQRPVHTGPTLIVVWPETEGDGTVTMESRALDLANMRMFDPIDVMYHALDWLRTQLPSEKSNVLKLPLYDNRDGKDPSYSRQRVQDDYHHEYMVQMTKRFFDRIHLTPSKWMLTHHELVCVGEVLVTPRTPEPNPPSLSFFTPERMKMAMPGILLAPKSVVSIVKEELAHLGDVELTDDALRRPMQDRLESLSEQNISLLYVETIPTNGRFSQGPPLVAYNKHPPPMYQLRMQHAPLENAEGNTLFGGLIVHTTSKSCIDKTFTCIANVVEKHTVQKAWMQGLGMLKKYVDSGIGPRTQRMVLASDIVSSSTIRCADVLQHSDTSPALANFLTECTRDISRGASIEEALVHATNAMKKSRTIDVEGVVEALLLAKRHRAV